MWRQNSTTWSVADPITAERLNDFNEDLDDIYTKGTDRGRIQPAASATPLAIDIAAFAYRVGSTSGLYAGGTDIALTDNATNYIEINGSWAIQINTTTWTATNGRLGTVTTVAGAITAITIWKPDVIGGELWGGGFTDLSNTIYKNGFLDQVQANSTTYDFTYNSFLKVSSITDGTTTWNITYNNGGAITWITQS